MLLTIGFGLASTIGVACLFAAPCQSPSDGSMINGECDEETDAREGCDLEKAATIQIYCPDSEPEDDTCEHYGAFFSVTPLNGHGWCDHGTCDYDNVTWDGADPDDNTEAQLTRSAGPGCTPAS